MRLAAVLCLSTLAWAAGPALTTVQDTIYRADGTPAGGTVLIAWPAFASGEGDPVAAGNQSVAIGTGGAFTTQLVPNAGATPAGTYYTVVFQLDDGTVRTEFWAVPTTSPANLAQVRTTPGAGSANQAATRQYVDAAVANVGAGNFVAKAGDTMTGPLTLSGDPAATNQASTKHYVDMGLAAKANLISGLVPTSQLGTGTANSTTCLLGNSMWGSCGGGGGAASVYATTNYATDFQFTASPGANLGTPGAQTVTLSACPRGVRGDGTGYWVYISGGTGTAEAVLVTGGSCVGDGNPGTLQFTTANSHTGAYTITSASAGIAEASIAAAYKPQGVAFLSGGKIIAPYGDINIYGQLTIKSNGQTVEFPGGTQSCYSATTPCVFIGDSTNSNAVLDVTLVNFRGRPMVAGSTQPMVEVNAQKTRLLNLMGRNNGGATFGYWVKVDDDESFILDGLDTSEGLGTVRCDATFCGSYIYNPASFSTAPAVGWVKHANLNLQCDGNGIDWGGGNTLQVSDSVIQGYSQYGLRGGLTNGGYGNIKINNVYFEDTGSCGNPVDGTNPSSTGTAGIIIQGGSASVAGGEGPAGHYPTFANTGSTTYRYYIVPRHATYGYGNPLLAGSANTNGAGNITVKWPDIAGAASFDVLKVQAGTGVYGLDVSPNGSGNFAIATGLTRSAACSAGICSYVDSQAAPASYTVSPVQYLPKLNQWPGALVLSSGADTSATGAYLSGTLEMHDVNTANGFVGLNSVLGSLGISLTATRCPQIVGRSTALIACQEPSLPPTTQLSEATVLQTGTYNNLANLKGRLNFWGNGAAPGHIITLVDSNPQKTLSTQLMRPASDATDSYIGYDQGSNAYTNMGISFGAPVSLSNYIGNAGDGTSWLERLTATKKEFKVTAQFDSGLVLPQGNGYAPPAGGLGIDTTANLPVVNINGAVSQIALTSSNISGQAGTALALAATPTQCSASFATGIAANGNANCSTPNVIQMAETGQPTDPPNWGVLWFDSTAHAPKAMDNNGQAIQLGLTNLFNSDPGGDPANYLEQRNGTTAQNLRVYSSYTNNTTWQRASLGYDSADGGWSVVRSENANSGSAPGLGLWVGNGKRWVVDGTYNFKPWGDNLYNLGSDSGNAPKSIFAKTSFNSVQYGRNDFEIPNDTTTGTGLNQLAMFNANSPSQAVIASTGSSNGVIGLVQGGAGTGGSAVIAWRGYGYCIFDNATVAGHAVVASTTTAGDCHDSGSTGQPSAPLIGYVDVTNTTAGMTNGMRISLQGPGGGGAVSSVFGRTGAVVAASGDYSVSQITGAAADAAVVHLAGTETVTGVKTFSSDVTLGGNLNVAGAINQTGAGPWQLSGVKWTGTSVTVPSGKDFSVGVGSDNVFKCQLGSGASCMPTGGGVTSVFGRTGVVVAASGDYTVSQVTGAAPLASPALTGTPTAPTPGTGDNSANLATTAFVKAQGYLTSDAVSSVFGRTGAVAAASGDYTVAQVTGAAPLASPAFTGTPTIGGANIPTTGTLVSGNYAKASGAGAIADSTVNAGPYAMPWFTSVTVQTSTPVAFNTTNNKAQLWGVVLGWPLSTTKVWFDVAVADTGSCTYDVGLLNTSGNIVVHTGNHTAAALGMNATGWHSYNWTGATTIQPGKYYVALTASANSGCATLGASSSGTALTFASNVAESVTAGGTLNSGITIPADSYTAGTIPAFSVN